MHRRNHKERAQPLARAKLGLLEKKKDYVLRARDYKSKKERLKRLREKAAFRNKDEFYWGMIKAKTQGGVHVQERSSSNTLGVDEVKLLKSQDAGYVRLAIAKDESVGCDPARRSTRHDSPELITYLHLLLLQKITALKTQLQVLTSLFPSLPSASNSDPDSWSDMDEGSADEDADELEDVDMETLEEAGLVARSKKVNVKGKGKETGQVGRGHTVFTDDKDERECFAVPRIDLCCLQSPLTYIIRLLLLQRNSVRMGTYRSSLKTHPNRIINVRIGRGSRPRLGDDESTSTAITIEIEIQSRGT